MLYTLGAAITTTSDGIHLHRASFRGVRSVCKGKKAQAVAASQVKIMRKVCNLIVKKKGEATGL